MEVEIPTEEGETSEEVEAELPEAARTLLQRAVELTRTHVSEVMIPSSAIVSLPSTVTAHEAAETLRRTGRSRIPIFGANRDDIVGILIGKDLWERMVDSDDPESVVPAQLVRPAYCVPETCNAFQVIEELRGNRTGMAIVLNEYGAVAGLVTLEDLLEQLVGPIDDEHDVPAPTDPIRPLEGSRFDVDASLPLEVLNERLGLHLPTEEEFQTIGGLALHALGRLPEDGEKFRHERNRVHGPGCSRAGDPPRPDRPPARGGGDGKRIVALEGSVIRRSLRQESIMLCWLASEDSAGRSWEPRVRA